MEKITFIIADDHVLIAEMWSALLSSNPAYEVKAKVKTCQELGRMVALHKPDIVILDIALSDGSSLGMIPELRTTSPLTRYLAVSAYSDLPTVKKAFSSGVNGYMTKTSSLPEISDAITALMAGKKYQCREIQNVISGMFLDSDADGKALTRQPLTKKELQIAYLIYKGLTAKEIAEQIGLSSKTVNVHRHNIYQKLGIQKVTRLIMYVQQNLHLFTNVEVD